MIIDLKSDESGHISLTAALLVLLLGPLSIFFIFPGI